MLKINLTRQTMYVRVTLLGIPITIIVMETQPCFPIVLLFITFSC